MDELVFDKESHIYMVNGEEIPGVSYILQEAGIAIPSPFYTEAGRVRGHKVHAACEYLDQDDLDYSTLDSETLPYVQAYENFLKETGFKSELIEHKKAHPIFKYAGTIDRVGILNEEKVVLDIKTGTQQISWPIQLAAYDMLINDTPDAFENTNFSKRIALQLNKNGTYRLHTYSNLKDYNVFIAALEIAKWKRSL